MLIAIEEVKAKYPYIYLDKNIEFDFSRGKIILVLGDNGVGKSTLLNYIYDTYQTQMNIFYVPQKLVILNGISIENFIVLLKQRYNFIKDPYQLMEELNLDFNSKKSIKRLSGGEKQKVMLAIGLAIDCELLLLDEPLNNLDDITCNKIEQLLNDSPGNKIVVSHKKIKASQEVELCSNI